MQKELILLILLPLSLAAWYNSAWQYRKAITIDHTKVVSDLTNFPVLIDITDSDLASKAQSDGADILFTTSDGTTKIPHEIEDYNSANGHLVAWVKIPTLSSASDTVIYMYYGNPSASDQQDANSVWDSNFVLVQHLNETSGLHYDSTSYANNGTPQGSLLQDVYGIANGADKFDGNSAYIDFGSDTTLNPTSQLTYEVWIKWLGDANQLDDLQNIITNGAWYRALRITEPDHWQASKILFQLSINGSTNYLYSSTSLLTNAWYYIVATYDGSAIHIYINGYEDANSSVSGTIDSGTSNTIAGMEYSSCAFFGYIDEIRISNIARPKAWIITSYNNQSDPSSFYTVSAEETGANNAPEATISYPNGYEALSGTKQIKFYVKDPDIQSQSDGTLYVTLAYSTSQLGFENKLTNDENIYNTSVFSCEDYNFADLTLCEYSWNTSSVLDGYYYVDINVRDDFNAFCLDSSDNSFIVDNTAPQTTDDAPTAPQTQPFTITLTCTDNLSGCKATYYRVDLGSWREGDEIAITTNGTHRIDYYSIDYADNSETIHTIYVTLNFSGNHTFTIVLNLDGNYLDSKLYVRNHINGLTTSTVETQTITSSSNIGYALFAYPTWLFGIVSNAACNEIDITNNGSFTLSAKQYVLPNNASEFFLTFTETSVNSVEKRMGLVEKNKFLKAVEPSFAYPDKAYRTEVGLSYKDTMIDINSDLHLGPGTHAIKISNCGVINDRVCISIARQ